MPSIPWDLCAHRCMRCSSSATDGSASLAAWRGGSMPRRPDSRMLLCGGQISTSNGTARWPDGVMAKSAPRQLDHCALRHNGVVARQCDRQFYALDSQIHAPGVLVVQRNDVGASLHARFAMLCAFSCVPHFLQVEGTPVTCLRWLGHARLLSGVCLAVAWHGLACACAYAYVCTSLRVGARMSACAHACHHAC